MNSIQDRIRISVFVMCLILCVPYLAHGASRADASPEQLIAYVRGQHFPGYSATDGYPAMGEALEKFFSNGVWKYEYDQFVSFTGIAQNNGQKARFKWIFSFMYSEYARPPFGAVLGGNTQVNGIRVTDKEYANILAAVMLN